MMVLFIFTTYNYFTQFIHEYKIGVDNSYLCACFKGVWMSGGTSSAVINKALNGGELSASRPRSPYPHVKSLRCTVNGGSVGYKAGLEASENRDILYPCWESNTVTRFPILCLSTLPTALPMFIHNKRDT
jgi:hypothetical protein